MSELKKPLAIPEQIQKIQEHGMIVDDAEAGRILHRVSYYRLSGYALQYRVSTNSHQIQPGTSLDDVYAAYRYDEELRGLLGRYVGITEWFYKCLIGNEFALRHCVQPPHDQHYDAQCYYDKAAIQRTLQNFSIEQNYYRDSQIVRHHRQQYQSKMPLWVMLELMTYSSMSMYYHAMYQSDKDAIASSIGISSGTLENHLHCLSVLRNKCAHGARLYNTALNPPVRFTKNYLRQHPEINNRSVFAYILMLFRRLPCDADRIEFRSALSGLVNHYKGITDMALLGIPENYLDLMRV